MTQNGNRHSSSRGKKAPRRKAQTQRSKVEISAGGIVYKRTPQGVRIAFILDPFGKWAFAKGHVEKGETIEQAAVRETREEMGLEDVKVVRPLGKIDFWFRDRYRPETRGVLVHKYVHYYLMEAPADAKGRPQKQEKIRRVIWVGLPRMLRRSSYDDVRSILDEVRRHFEATGDAPPRKEKDGGGEERSSERNRRRGAGRRRRGRGRGGGARSAGSGRTG